MLSCSVKQAKEHMQTKIDLMISGEQDEMKGLLAFLSGQANTTVSVKVHHADA